MPPNVIEYITHCGKSYGKVKIVLKNNRYFLETTDPVVLQILLKDPEIGPCRVEGAEEITTSAPTTVVENPRAKEASTALYLALGEEDDDNDNDNDRHGIHAFQIADEKVGTVAQRCLALHYPAVEEYDFRKDHLNADLNMDLRLAT
ncbi:MAG: hypothetical protein M1819_004658 [Sarea resinae]|nr:MAG: hypothetical protein M1819_004658 [Sarea resinae]